MTYAEHLRANGATEEDIKILDSPVARKAFDAQQAAIAAAAADAEKRVADFKAQTDTWYNETIVPNYTKMEREAAAAKANEARARALILASQDEGLKKVAEEMGFKPDATTTTQQTTQQTQQFDASKFLTVDTIKPLLDSAGDGLAALEDMVAEHAQLFPNQRLSVRELRRESLAAKAANVYEYWEKKYKVPEARAAAQEAAQKAHDDAIRAEARKAAESEFASKYASPDLRPMVPSTNPFAARPDRKDQGIPQPGDPSRTMDRVARATKAVMESAAKLPS